MSEKQPQGPPPAYSAGGYAPPPGPPPSRSNNPFLQSSEYAPPSGPPPSHNQSSQYAPPQGPPPSHGQYAPPPGPPPAFYDASDSNSPAAAQGQGGAEPPPYPPPPGLAHANSPLNNASPLDAQSALQWCAAFPLTPPFPLPPAQLANVRAGAQDLLAPQGFQGRVERGERTGNWRVTSTPGCRDSLLQAALPAYSCLADSPLHTERAKTVYFEVRILALGNDRAAGASSSSASKSRLGGMFSRGNHASNSNEESGVALGFFAPPYPPFRLPGWQRGSLGVHSDDGRKYIGNDEGGTDFTHPFRAGETIGLGLTYSVHDAYRESGQGAACDAAVFLTRDGRKTGGWNLLSDTDAGAESVEGLTGGNDVFPAIGVFGPVEVEVNFAESAWLYRGWGR